VLDVCPADQIHHVSDVVHLGARLNHHVPANLHGVVGSLDLMVCELHLRMDDAHQNAQDALLALDYLLGLKDEMVFVLFHPCDSPSRFLLFYSMTFTRGK
jgi:hypothetical protein